MLALTSPCGRRPNARLWSNQSDSPCTLTDWVNLEPFAVAPRVKSDPLRALEFAEHQ
jgi:hypothetical protein